VIAGIQEHVESVRLPSWPVFALVDSDTTGWLSGFGESLGQSQNGITSMRIDNRPAGKVQRLIVQTQHDQSYWPSLHALLAQLDPDEGSGEPLELGVEDDGAPASPPAANVTVFIDGEPTPAIASHDSDRTVWYARTQDVAAVVAARCVRLKVCGSPVSVRLRHSMTSTSGSSAPSSTLKPGHPLHIGGDLLPGRGLGSGAPRGSARNSRGDRRGFPPTAIRTKVQCQRASPARAPPLDVTLGVTGDTGASHMRPSRR